MNDTHILFSFQEAQQCLATFLADARTQIMLVVALQLLVGQVALAQPDPRLHPQPKANGWTQYEHEFKIELPRVFKTSFISSDDGRCWFATRDSLNQVDFEHDNSSQFEHTIFAVVENVDSGSSNAWNKVNREWPVHGYSKKDSIHFAHSFADSRDELNSMPEGLSGKETERIFNYLKAIKYNANVYRLMIVYSVKDKELMDSVLPRIAASFH